MFDLLIVEIDKGLRTLWATAPTVREVPGREFTETVLSASDKRHAAALMRINHVGEICAQALYQGQVLTCRNPEIRKALEKAAQEETDHLAWTERRIDELGGLKSVFNPLWYFGALTFGTIAGWVGDDWSLGFLAETERQVEAHLERHLSELPAHDTKSRAVVLQMKADERSHAETAVGFGARDLPPTAKAVMRLMAGIMTRTAYFL